MAGALGIADRVCFADGLSNRHRNRCAGRRRWSSPRCGKHSGSCAGGLGGGAAAGASEGGYAEVLDSAGRSRPAPPPSPNVCASPRPPGCGPGDGPVRPRESPQSTGPDRRRPARRPRGNRGNRAAAGQLLLGSPPPEGLMAGGGIGDFGRETSARTMTSVGGPEEMLDEL